MLCLWVAGCATVPTPTVDRSNNDEADQYIAKSYCSPAVSPETVAREQRQGPSTVQPEQAYAEHLAPLSSSSRQIARVIQVEDLVARIPVVENDVSRNVPGARLRLLELRQELSDKLLLALFDASSVAAELECEKGRADALAAGLEEVQNDVQQRRTVIALLADAIAGLLSGLFLFGGTEVLAGGADIIGNVLQGSFGYAVLGGQQQYELRLTRNLLQEVWEGSESSMLIPESVWRFLNSSPSTDRQVSRRDLIVQEWKKRLGQVGQEKDLRRVQLYFGDGGVYTGNELRRRAEMLDRLKASIRLMNQDLNALFKESLGSLSGAVRMADNGTMTLID